MHVNIGVVILYFFEWSCDRLLVLLGIKVLIFYRTYAGMKIADAFIHKMYVFNHCE